MDWPGSAPALPQDRKWQKHSSPPGKFRYWLPKPSPTPPPTQPKVWRLAMFDVQWDYPSVEPPNYLLRLNPQLYEQERQRINARFEEAVQLAEQAFLGEFGRLVEHLVKRLGSGADGQKQIFRDSAISNLTEFFGRFRSLNVHSNGELDRLVDMAQRAVQGVEPQALRDNDALRQQITTQFSAVQATLDGLLVDQPRRKILRQNREALE
jgi:hypothetical protein